MSNCKHGSLDYLCVVCKEIDEIKRNTLKVLCPFCNSLWTAEMIAELEQSEGCDTCGCGEGMYCTITIYCDHCKKLVYKKEFMQNE